MAARAGRYRLDAAALSPHALGVSRPDGRSRYGRKAAGEESPGSIDIRCRITSGGGDPRDSATENEPPAFALRSCGEVRVKRCGKSAPRVRQRKRHGKPHREQDRIGTATRVVRESENTAGRCQARRPGRLLEAMCKHCPRGMAVTYRLRKRAVPYKTRLTGRLISLTRKRFRAKWNSGSRQRKRVLPAMRGLGVQHAGLARSHLVARSDIHAPDDLLQQRHQRFRRGDVRRMAGVDFDNSASPARLLARAGERAEGVRRRGAHGVDIAARQRRLAVAAA